MPELTTVLRLLALSFAVAGWENIALVRDRQRLSLQRPIKLCLLAHSLSTLLTIALALEIRSAWVLACKPLSFHILLVVLSYRSYRFRPRWITQVAPLQQFWHFARTMPVISVCLFALAAGPELILGLLLDVSSLGLFVMAANLTAQPFQALQGALAGVLFPAIANADLRSRQQYPQYLPLLMLLMAVPFLPLMFAPQWLATALLGDHWRACASLFPPLAVCGLLRCWNLLPTLLFFGNDQPALERSVSIWETIGFLGVLATGTWLWQLPQALYGAALILALGFVARSAILMTLLPKRVVTHD